MLIGDAWKAIFDQLFQRMGDYSPEGQRELIQFAVDIKTALSLLEN